MCREGTHRESAGIRGEDDLDSARLLSASPRFRKNILLVMSSFRMTTGRADRFFCSSRSKGLPSSSRRPRKTAVRSFQLPEKTLDSSRIMRLRGINSRSQASPLSSSCGSVRTSALFPSPSLGLSERAETQTAVNQFETWGSQR